MAGYAFVGLSLCLLATAESNIALWSNSTASSSTHTVPEPRTSNSISSTRSSATSSADIGAFVAAGMGMTRSSTSTISETTSTSSIASDPLSHIDESAPAVTAAPKGNYTLSFTGNCWQQWSSYWAANSSASRAWTATSLPATHTYTITENSYSYTSSPISGTTTVTVYNGAHPQDTYTTVTQISVSYTATTEPTNTYTTTYVRDDWTSIDLFGNGTLVKPTCTLPSYVPECQAMWEDWIYHKYDKDHRSREKPVGCTSNIYSDVQAPSCSGPVASYLSAEDRDISLAIRDPPSCTQASVTGAPCTTLYDAFQSNANYYGHNTEGRVGGGMNWTTYTTTTGTENEVATITTNHFFWDPSSTFAPGCTLGCQSCQVNGGTVQLIYWPPESSTWINGNYSAITGNATGPVTIETLGTTLTSPTVYVSFDSLYARDSCSFFGTTHYDQIVAITNTNNLSSIHGWGRYNGLGASASFNFTDLYVSPVPDYIYQSQPRCASSYAMFDPRRGDRVTQPANWTCPRTADYDPILAIPLEVRDIDPDWAGCVGGIDGVYDPPIALTPKDSIALPTVPGSNPKDTSDATPAPTPKPTDAPNTSPSEPDKPSKTASPEVKPPSLGPDPKDSPSPKGDDQPKETKQPAEPADEPTDPLSILFNALFSANPEETGTPDNHGSSESSGSDSHGSDSSSDSDSAENDKPAPNQDEPSKHSDSSNDNKPAPNPQDPSDPSEPEPFTGDASSPHDTPIATVVSLPGGGSATIQEAGGSVIIEQEGLSAGATRGGVATIGTHVYSADGSAIVIDDSVTHAGPAHAIPTKENEPPAAVWTHAGETFSAIADGSSVVVQGSGAATTLPAGAAATFAGEKLSVPASGGMLVHGDSTATFGQKAAGSEDGSATTIVYDGETIVASATGSKVVFQQGGSAVTLDAGQQTVIDGQTLSVAPLGGGVVIDGGETHAVPAAPTNAGNSKDAITTFVHDGETFTASATGSNMVFQHDGSKVTISAGQQTVIDGQTFSIVPSGGAVVIDGSETRSLPHVPTPTGDSSIIVHDGETFTASATGNNVVFQHDGSKFTVSAGDQTVIDGQTLSVVPSGGAVVIDGSETRTLPTPTSNSDSSIIVHDGETFTASATGSNVVLQHDGSKVTISAGQQTVIDGQTFSVMPSGGAVVVDGSETFSLPAQTTSEDATGGSTTRSASRTASEADASGTQSAVESGDDEDDADSAASRLASSFSLVVGVLSCMAVMAWA